ncbi:MAG: RIP metalloprotease RseP [Pseudanabaenaceae cyanobacterium]
MSVVGAIAVLAVLVLVHEAGHFAAARALGIRVSQFSIGFGPALWSVQGPTVEYAVRAIPLGGYVGFPQDPDQPNDPDLLPNRPVWQRMVVMVAGVTANLGLALLLCILTAVGGGVVAAEQPGIQVVALASPTAPAAIAGLRPGDIVRRVDGQTVGQEVGILTQFQRQVADYSGVPLRLTVERQGLLQETVVVPVGEPARIGVTLDYVGALRRQPAPNVWVALRVGSTNFGHLLSMTLTGLAQLVVDLPGNVDRVAGPVAIVAAGSEMARSGWLSLLEFAAMVSINLAVVNLLPLPALDGGQLLFLAIEALRGGRPLSPGIQQNVMQGGLVLLLGLGAVTLVRDSWSLLNQTGWF